MAYCLESDIKLGDLETPRYVSVSEYVDQSAERIDAMLGKIYKLPLNVSLSDPNLRPTALLLKQINMYDAMGRIIIAAAGGGEDNSLHALGMYYLKEAQRTISAILSGDWPLIGQVLIGGPTTDEDIRGPIIRHKDASSFVQGFYADTPNTAPPWIGAPHGR
jgi:hypothetical protein